jgi:hypothetical protein
MSYRGKAQSCTAAPKKMDSPQTPELICTAQDFL